MFDACYFIYFLILFITAYFVIEIHVYINFYAVFLLCNDDDGDDDVGINESRRYSNGNCLLAKRGSITIPIVNISIILHIISFNVY